MLARRYGLVLAFLLIPIEARAHLHKAGAFFARSFDEGSRLGGFTIGGEFMLAGKTPGDSLCHGYPASRCTSWLSLFVYTSTNWGPHNGGDRTQFALLGGVRATYTIPPLGERVELYGHGIGAFVHTQDSKPNTVDRTGGAGVGGGIAFDLRPSLRPKHEVVAKVQLDYLWLGGVVSHYRLLSVGIEYRFGSWKH